MKLSEQQQLFARRVPYLMLKAFELGYEITGGDWHRSQRCPYGSKNSKHHTRLAIDLNLFFDGEYLQLTSDHLALGMWWKSIGGIWGGDFNDGNHYQAPKDPGDWMPIAEVAAQFHSEVANERLYRYEITSEAPIKFSEWELF